MSTADALSNPQVEPIDHGLHVRPLWSPAIVLAFVAQAERVVGVGVAFASRWFLGPADLGIYAGLRLLLDNTNRSSLGVALGAIQKSIALRARQDPAESDRILAIASTTNTFTSSIYGGVLCLWGLRTWLLDGDPRWGIGLALMGVLAVLKRRQDFQVAVLRSHSDFTSVGRVNILQNLAFGLSATLGILAFGFWGLLVGLAFSFMVQGEALKRCERTLRYPFDWNLPDSLRLAAIGLPILAANSAWAMVMTLDRALILTHFADGAKMAGYYSIAVLGCGILEDFASRVAIVLAPGYRDSFGKGASVESLLACAESTGLALLVITIPLGCVLALVGKAAFIAIFPNLAPGAEALGPLIPGTLALCALMPLREAWISADRPYVPASISALGAVFLALRIRSLSPDAALSMIASESSFCRIVTFLAMFAVPVIVLEWNLPRVFRWSTVAIWGLYWVGAFRLLNDLQPDPHGIGRAIVILFPAFPLAAMLHQAFFRHQKSGAGEPR